MNGFYDKGSSITVNGVRNSSEFPYTVPERKLINNDFGNYNDFIDYHFNIEGHWQMCYIWIWNRSHTALEQYKDVEPEIELSGGKNTNSIFLMSTDWKPNEVDMDWHMAYLVYGEDLYGTDICVTSKGNSKIWYIPLIPKE